MRDRKRTKGPERGHSGDKRACDVGGTIVGFRKAQQAKGSMPNRPARRHVSGVVRTALALVEQRQIEGYSLDAIREELEEQSGMTISPETFKKALYRARQRDQIRHLPSSVAAPPAAETRIVQSTKPEQAEHNWNAQSRGLPPPTPESVVPNTPPHEPEPTQPAERGQSWSERKNARRNPLLEQLARKARGEDQS